MGTGDKALGLSWERCLDLPSPGAVLPGKGGLEKKNLRSGTGREKRE